MAKTMHKFKNKLTGPARRLGTCAILGALTASLIGVHGCGGFFSPAFVNSFVGGTFPLTPGPNAAYVMVRGLNETNEIAEFVVTIERQIIETDEEGNFLFDDFGNPITQMELETRRVFTQAGAPANDVGILFDCSEFPVTRVGLGENLLPTDAAVFIGGGGPAGSPGFGISAAELSPLRLEVGNFNCGDTVIFRAFESRGVPGGVALQSFLLPGSEQPNSFAGPNTFANYEALLQTQVREDE